MYSVTAVPLRPIAKGSVRRLWLGVGLVAACAATLSWAGARQFGGTDSGLRYQMIKQGEGPHPTKDDFALIGYKGSLPDGTVFDQNEQTPMELANTVPGFSEAVTLMRKGGQMRVWIPADKAYGASPPPGIPANSPLQFDIKLIEFKTRAEIMEAQRQMQMQQMLQQQMHQQGGGASPVPGQPPQP
jgi:hypothetical protein